MKHIFIINPVAGKGKTMNLIPEIKKLAGAAGLDYEIEVTKCPGHATELAAKYAAQAICRIYSVGGDGTLNEVLNGMAGSDSVLAMIPSGSGNDFIKSISNKKDYDNIIKETIDGAEREIDLARVNGRYFLNISSLGFDAYVVYNTLKFKKLPFVTGSLAYVLGIFFSIIGRTSSDLKISIDDTTLKMEAMLAAVANGKYYGGGMLASPDAIIDDGLFDICLIEKKRRLAIMTLFPKFMKGQHGKIKGVSFKRGKKVTIESTRPVILNIDGEVSVISRADFEIIPKGIKIVIPA